MIKKIIYSFIFLLSLLSVSHAVNAMAAPPPPINVCEGTKCVSKPRFEVATGTTNECTDPGNDYSVDCLGTTTQNQGSVDSSSNNAGQESSTGDPQQEIRRNLPFPAVGVSCGLPNSEMDSCCTSGNSLHADSTDIDNLITRLSNGKKDLRQQDLDLLESLSLALTRDVKPTAQFLEFLKAADASGGLTNEQKVALRKTLTQGAQILNNMSGGDLARLQVDKTYPQDKDICLIHAFGGTGFCMRGTAEEMASVIGDNPNFAALMGLNKQGGAIEQCAYGTAKTDKSGSCKCVGNSKAQLCNDYLSNQAEYKKCAVCMVNNAGIWTGIGCIRTSSTANFVQDILLTWGIGFAGIISLLCIIYSAFLLQTALGNPERIKKAREYLTNCIIGLLLIIFSIFILKVIGVNILQIPGLV